MFSHYNQYRIDAQRRDQLLHEACRDALLRTAWQKRSDVLRAHGVLLLQLLQALFR